MARPRKTVTGAPAQPIAAPTGQPYGERQAQVEAQQQVPLEDTRRLAVEQMTATGNQLIAAQLQANPTGIAGRPDEMPGSPMTAGLAQGPGPGPEALAAIAPVDRTADVIRLAAAASGNPRLARLHRLVEARSQAQTPLSPYLVPEY